MKNIVLFIASFLCLNTLSAQQFQKLSAQRTEHNQIISGLLDQNYRTGGALKTASVAPSERVIAQNTRDSLQNRLDTVYLGYSLYRSSKYDYNTMLYAYNYPYNTSPVFNNDGGIFGKPQVLFDTFIRSTVDPNTLVYGYYETAYASYDAGNNMTGYLDLFADSSFNPNMKYANKFNAAKNIDTGYAYIWKAGVSDSAFRQFYAYNSSSKLTEDSTFEYHMGGWHLSSKSFYTYDGSNNLTQIDNYTNDTDTSFLQPLVEQYKYVNTYDGSGRLLTVLASFFDGTSLSAYIKDTFAYSGAYTYHSSWKEYQYDPINVYWAPIFYMSKVVNSATGLPDTVNINGFDSLLNAWVPQTKDVITYNASNDPVMLREYDYNFSYFPANPSYTTVYYYASYIDKTGVAETTALTDNVRIFPNPATNAITINGLDASVKNTRVSITLMNAQGQTVTRAGMNWQGEAQISLAGFTPGVYWVIIQDAAGNMLHRQAVEKQ